jgi:hypothetical protein
MSNWLRDHKRIWKLHMIVGTILIIALVISLSLNCWNYFSGECAFVSKERKAVVQRNHDLLEDFNDFYYTCQEELNGCDRTIDIPHLPGD